MKTMQRCSSGWFTIRMPVISSGAAPECEKLDGLCRADVRAAAFRVSYYWRVSAEQIYLVFLFAKGERSDLTPEQVRELARYVRELN
jgi:hypothetical protein